MQTYDELKKLAVLCAHNARVTTSTLVATELWNMARNISARPHSSASYLTLATRRLWSDERARWLFSHSFLLRLISRARRRSASASSITPLSEESQPPSNTAVTFLRETDGRLKLS